MMKEEEQLIHWPNGKSTYAKNGDSWFNASREAGIDIPSGCLTGSCGACEIEVNGKIYRACISSIPKSIDRELLVEFTDDPYW